jgi:hydrophobe/amphiphile efflux-1 (HAE1) family protein
MKLAEICVRKPVLSVVLSLVLVVLGVVAFKGMEIRFLPDLPLPMVTIDTRYVGASAALIESQVTTKIEDALAGIDGLKSLSSTSYSGRSHIVALFNYGGNFEQEASSVRDKVSSIHDKLPTDIETPTITVGATGNRLLGIGVIDEKKSAADLRNYVSNNLVPLIRQLPGVGSVGVMGSSGFALRIWLDAEKLASFDLTVADVKAALLSNNVYFPAGSIITPERSYGLLSKTQLTTPFGFEDIIVKNVNGGVIRVKDIGRVELSTRSLQTSPVVINGKNGIQMPISPLQSANPIAVAKEVREAVDKLRPQLPEGMTMTLDYDGATFLKSSVDETFISIAEAVILVVLVVFLFLGSIRASLIPIITIPVSIISVFFIIAWLGFTINMMSLLGLVLAIGLVVDDAIVVLENIHRHIEMGKTPFQAAIEGSREIGFAVVAMTITLVAVYAPLGIMQGVTAQLFKEFAFTLAAAVVISGFVALTLSPMMCSKILKSDAQSTRMAQRVDIIFTHATGWYERRLGWCLNHRLLVVLGMLVLAAVGFLLFRSLNAEMLPKDDTGLVLIEARSPPGASLNYSKKSIKPVLDLVMKQPGIADSVVLYGTSNTEIGLLLKPWNVRGYSAQELVAKLNPQLAKIPALTATAMTPDVVNYGEQGSAMTINLMTSGDYQELIQPINQLVVALKAYPGLIDVRTSLKFDSQQYAITINRNLAGIMGVNLQDIADTIDTMMAGIHWSDVQSGKNTYPVMVQMDKKDLKDFSAINKLYVRSSNPPSAQVLQNPDPQLNPSSFSGLIPISVLVKLTPQVGQGSFTHYNRFRSGVVSAGLAPGVSEGEAVKKVQQIIASTLGSKVKYAFSGKAQQYMSSQGSIAGIFLLSVIFIYLVLAAQFGSFWDPLTILLAVPLSIVGALLVLKLTGATLSIYSEIGLVTLVGLIAKHGILITQFANDLRHSGEELYSAVRQAAATRLRPILMTTLAMIMGALPLALATGPGSIGRMQIGWVIVSGLFFGTFFSLVVVPVIYTYFGRFRKINRGE